MRAFVTNSLFAVASFGITAGLVAFSAPAVAADFAPRQAVVRTDDLNLRSPAGVATARHRIHAAAAQVCFDDGMRVGAEAQCRTQAVSDAEQALDSKLASTGSDAEYAAR